MIYALDKQQTLMLPTCWDRAQELKQRTYIFYSRKWLDREKEK